MSVLIIENMEWTPHLETGMEIALKLRRQGQEVHYLCVRGLGGHFEDRPFRARKLWSGRDLFQPKMQSAMWVLQQHGVHIHRPQFLRDSAPVPEFADQEALKSYYENGWDIGMGVASSLISWSKQATARPQDHRAIIVRMMRASRLVYRNVLALCQSLKPEQVVLFNGRFASSRPSLRVAQKLGLDWRVHERGCDPEHYYFYDFVPHDMGRWAQQIMAESSQQSIAVLEQAAAQFYSRRRAGGAKDWYSFANWKSGDLGPYESLRERKPVVYFSSSDDEFVAIGELLEKDAPFVRQIDAVRFLAEQCKALNLPLVVRLHPHLAQKSAVELRAWHEQLQGLVEVVIDASEKVDSYALMDAASLCVSYGSTAGIEANYWGHQHFMLGRALYETLPGVCWARQPEQLRALLQSPPPIDRDGAIRYGWYMETFGETFDYFKPDGLLSGQFLGESLAGEKGYWRWLAARLGRSGTKVPSKLAQ